ncbi:MAG: CbrC family protein [Ktedonobacterales bacterium]
MSAIAAEPTAELEQRTPHLVTWQDFFWPAHCGDYCRFLKEVGQPEIERLATVGGGIAFLAAHCPDIADRQYAMEIWQAIRHDTPAGNSIAYAVSVHWFRCLVCDESVLLWDCD